MEEAATLAGVPFTMDKLSGATIARKDAALALQQWLKLDAAPESFKDVPDQSEFASAVGALNAAGLMKVTPTLCSFRTLCLQQATSPF